ncbi:hypothetical protein [Myxococcus sp. AB025B]|uniref:hypothetical protein n=1 Tax=Myxococcus sp. AB025B TaxID=2562794 RepID=UPI0011414853|nr:hypothetical protein [Myxococcus sp. AB025B]
MAARAVAVRRGMRMEEFKTRDPLDETFQRPVRLPLRLWAKVDVLAKRAAAAGKVSPHTNRPVSANDIVRSFVEHSLSAHELTEGEIRVAPPPAAKKKPAAKKGRGT